MLDRFDRAWSVRRPRRGLCRAPPDTSQAWLLHHGRHKRVLAELNGVGIANRGTLIRCLTADWSRNRRYRLTAGLRLDLARILSRRSARFFDLSTIPA
jgi:hypothetical protein